MMKKPSIVLCMHNYRDVQVIHCVKSYQCHTHYHLKYTANEKKKIMRASKAQVRHKILLPVGVWPLIGLFRKKNLAMLNVISIEEVKSGGYGSR